MAGQSKEKSTGVSLEFSIVPIQIPASAFTAEILPSNGNGSFSDELPRKAREKIRQRKTKRKIKRNGSLVKKRNQTGEKETQETKKVNEQSQGEIESKS
ncbi:hypothetical protein RUM43_008910 [Polyplax serrata]|uniref:Uncharacterized protein n=1 Tax=Polyplax serrata TaxID=468196 RepID=A0AAN8S1N6_POLSC